MRKVCAHRLLARELPCFRRMCRTIAREEVDVNASAIAGSFQYRCLCHHEVLAVGKRRVAREVRSDRDERARVKLERNAVGSLLGVPFGGGPLDRVVVLDGVVLPRAGARRESVSDVSGSHPEAHSVEVRDVGSGARQKEERRDDEPPHRALQPIAVNRPTRYTSETKKLALADARPAPLRRPQRPAPRNAQPRPIAATR
jgi:hypothetical protein